MKSGMKNSHKTPFSVPSFTRCLLMLPMPFCLCLLRVCPVESRDFTLGFLVPYTGCKTVGNSYYCGETYASGITVALEKINSDPHLLAGHNVTYTWNDTECDQTRTIKQQLHQLKEGVDAFIGPGCDCDTAAVVAEATDKTMISYECTSFSTGKLTWPRTFLRTLGNVDEHIAPSILSLLQRYNWTKVGIVYENRTKYILLKNFLHKNLETSTIKYEVRGTDKVLPKNHFNIKEALVNDTFKNVKNESKILIFLTTVWISRPTIYWLRKLRLVLNDTVFIICETDPIELSDFNSISTGVHSLLKDYSDVKSDGNLTSKNTARLLRYLDSVFMIAARSPRGREYKKFTSEVKARIKEAPFYSTAYNIYKNAPPPVQAASLYDAVNLYAIGLNITLAQGKPLTGVNIADNIKGLGKFKSIRGFDMILDKRGSAQYGLELYQIRNTKNINKVLIPVGIFILNTSEDTRSILILDGKENITWPGGGNEPPKDERKCGWNGVCPIMAPTTDRPGEENDEQLLTIMFSIAVVLCVLVLLLLFIFMRHYRLEKELKSQLWKIKFSDLSFHFRQDSSSPHQTVNGEEFSFDWCEENNKLTAVARYKSVVCVVLRCARCVALRCTGQCCVELCCVFFLF